ncbi:hypothetical protein [Ancylobacter lacus]|uniref:hypothetical protein n=1 Tax=Ancylobacter lacus TaxID=2579970 RepID=UPI001BCC46AF|nr:hypothetical protein [Ancylobacter lacus]MBS7538991.1 hypothetical protein [Ancylobacter lacus]
MTPSARLMLIVAVAAIAAITLGYFITSFFVLDEVETSGAFDRLLAARTLISAHG